MPEEENKETPEEETKEEEVTAIEAATKLHQDIKAENDRHEALIERQEKLAAQNMLGGRSAAGQAPEEPKELTPEEYTKKVLAGEVPE